MIISDADIVNMVGMILISISTLGMTEKEPALIGGYFNAELYKQQRPRHQQIIRRYKIRRKAYLFLVALGTILLFIGSCPPLLIQIKFILQHSLFWILSYLKSI